MKKEERKIMPNRANERDKKYWNDVERRHESDRKKEEVKND